MVPNIDLSGRKLSTGEMWEMTGLLTRVLNSFEYTEPLKGRLEKLLTAVFSDSDLLSREGRLGEEAMFSVPIYALLPSPAMAVGHVLGEILGNRSV